MAFDMCRKGGAVEILTARQDRLDLASESLLRLFHHSGDCLDLAGSYAFANACVLVDDWVQETFCRIHNCVAF